METLISESEDRFPATHWSRLAAVRGQPSGREEALKFLAERYWKPVYLYVRQRGYDEEQAKDLVQEFFFIALRDDWFAKADPERGRFRNFLLKSLQHFLANAHRAAGAKKRQPTQGFVPIHEMATEKGPMLVPKDTRAPDDAFHRAWLREIVIQVLQRLEDECLACGKKIHFELLRQRVIAPILDGVEVPSLHELAKQHELTEKLVSAYVISARRAYQRLMRDEIRRYAASEEEVAVELQDLWRFMSE